MPHRNAFPLLGTLATTVVGVLGLALSLALNHPEVLDVFATDGGALLTRCVAIAFPT
jgi:hypothetical protein